MIIAKKDNSKILDGKIMRYFAVDRDSKAFIIILYKMERNVNPNTNCKHLLRLLEMTSEVENLKGGNFQDAIGLWGGEERPGIV